MKNNRRNFLKLAGMAGLSMAGSNVLKGMSVGEDLALQAKKARKQEFNMSGYAAPKLDKVRAGFIGLGQRGPSHMNNLSLIEGVEIKALCDVRPEKAEEAKKRLTRSGANPDLYTKGEEDWKRLCDRDDIDIVYIATPWSLHTPQAVYAMNHGKHVFIEVPATVNLDESWQLVEASEKNKKHCMMLENCCYDFFELLTLNMARQGFFGELVHGEGAYIHNLIDLNFNKNGYYKMWRLEENASRQGNLYPTHGLGPICQIMNINRGDRMEYLVALMSADFQMNKEAIKRAEYDPFYKPFVDRKYRGNMTTTAIRTAKGRSIMIQHDVTSPNAYSRIHKVSGTLAAALKYPEPPKISVGDDWLKPDQMKELEAKYRPEIVKRVGEMAKQVGGHGGMDFLMDWRVVDCLRNGLPLDQDVYDAATWSAVAPLSEWSVANRSNSIDVPDFTGGSWKTNKPVDITLSQGGNTKILR